MNVSTHLACDRKAVLLQGCYLHIQCWVFYIRVSYLWCYGFDSRRACVEFAHPLRISVAFFCGQTLGWLPV